MTHEDSDYMNKYYDLDPKRNDQYFVRIDPKDNEKLDMSFNLSNYQPQLLENKSRSIFQTIFLDDTRSHLWSKDEIDKNKILLEKWWHQFAHTWKHFAYFNLLFSLILIFILRIKIDLFLYISYTVPFVRFIQNTKNTWYCGSYTLFNTHEVRIHIRVLM